MISRQEVENLANLARIKLTESEITSLQKDISGILEYVGQVSANAAPADIRPVPALRNVLREDAPRAADDPLAHKRERILAAAPRREGEYFVVRKIIQKDE